MLFEVSCDSQATYFCAAFEQEKKMRVYNEDDIQDAQFNWFSGGDVESNEEEAFEIRQRYLFLCPIPRIPFSGSIVGKHFLEPQTPHTFDDHNTFLQNVKCSFYIFTFLVHVSSDLDFRNPWPEQVK